MYSTEAKGIPKKLVVKSQAGAETDLEEWIRANDLKNIPDVDGHIWHLEVTRELIPDRVNAGRNRHIVYLQAFTDMGRDQLVQEGIFDAEKDGRLLGLLGEKRVRLAMSPVKETAWSEDEIRSILMDHIARIRKNLSSPSVSSLKRELAGRYVDRKSVFGAAAD